MSLQEGWKDYSLRFEEGDLKLLKWVEEGRFESREAYQLNLLAHQASLIQEFEELICLPTLRNMEHYPYQIEAARKVLRRFRGRALLCDEVGLGKTIEAGIILKEYMMRGLVRKALILTPPGLVEQWKEEMEAKFDLSFITHEDPEFKALGKEAWAHFPLVIASLPTAKAVDHASMIQGIRYDLVIVDEAHHLRSRSTVNWQFVNVLDKKFILLLTATPVQNDLEELFNLVTILKPGQLKTLRQFKREFVTRGERRRPKNIQTLRELLGECMIRNSRSQVEQRLPPRSAHTIRLKPTTEQKALYEAVSDFVRELHPQVGYQARGINRLVLQTMQMEVGSSARALLPTVEKLLTGGRVPQGARGRLEAIRGMAAGITESTK
ncbi:MAG: DEAD/DEAH box helicase, partial [candidate division NC10 bacterium]|nr:DEAD/DEAH box helicase [candidate division NC10 bacterium]